MIKISTPGRANRPVRPSIISNLQDLIIKNIGGFAHQVGRVPGLFLITILSTISLSAQVDYFNVDGGWAGNDANGNAIIKWEIRVCVAAATSGVVVEVETNAGGEGPGILNVESDEDSPLSIGCNPDQWRGIGMGVLMGNRMVPAGGGGPGNLVTPAVGLNFTTDACAVLEWVTYSKDYDSNGMDADHYVVARVTTPTQTPQANFDCTTADGNDHIGCAAMNETDLMGPLHSKATDPSCVNLIDCDEVATNNYEQILGLAMELVDTIRSADGLTFKTIFAYTACHHGESDYTVNYDIINPGNNTTVDVLPDTIDNIQIETREWSVLSGNGMLGLVLDSVRIDNPGTQYLQPAPTFAPFGTIVNHTNTSRNQDLLNAGTSFLPMDASQNNMNDVDGAQCNSFELSCDTIYVHSFYTFDFGSASPGQEVCNTFRRINSDAVGYEPRNGYQSTGDGPSEGGPPERSTIGYDPDPEFGDCGNTDMGTCSAAPGEDCDPLDLAVCAVRPPVCTPPTNITFGQSAATCMGATAQDDGTITLTGHTNGTHYGVSNLSAATYDGPMTTGTATPISGMPVIENDAPNSGGTYIIRIFNTDNTCFTDEIVTVAPVVCMGASPTCSPCNEFLSNLVAVGSPVPDPTSAFSNTTFPYCGTEGEYPGPLTLETSTGFTSTVSCGPTAQPYRGLDETYMTVVGGDFTVPNNGGRETEGRVAVGGDLIINQTNGAYGMAESGGGTLVIGAPGDAVTVEGNLSGSGNLSVGVNNGSGSAYTVYLGGSNNLTGSLTSSAAISAGNGTSVVDHASILCQMDAASMTMMSTPATGTFANVFGVRTITGTNAALEVIHMNGSDLDPGFQDIMAFADIAPGATIVVNVSGTNITSRLFNCAGRVNDPFTSCTASDKDALVYNVVWNFYEATSLNILGNFQGLLLLPNGDLDLGSNLNGRAFIGGNLTHTGMNTEIHNYTITADLTSFCTTTSVCTNPSAITAMTTLATCDGSTALSNASVILTSTMDGTHYNITQGSDYSGGDMDINNATSYDETADLPLVIDMTLPNPSVSQDYTIRIFNGASDCYTDHTVTIGETTCACDVTIAATSFSSCASGMFDARITLDWVDAPLTGNIEYAINGGSYQPLSPARTNFNGTTTGEVITITGLTCNTTKTMTLRFVGETTCLEELVFVFPPGDPAGHIYCEESGEIISGGMITVTPPPGGSVSIGSDGSTGHYYWLVTGSPVVAGIYTMEYTPSIGFDTSTVRLPGVRAGDTDDILDPTGTSEDNPTSLDPLLLGSDTVVGGATLMDFSASANPFFRDFLIEANDPFVDLNNIPLSGCTSDFAITLLSNSPVCENERMVLNVRVPDPLGIFGNTYTYNWTGPNGFTSTDANPFVTGYIGATYAGTYTVVVTNTSNGEIAFGSGTVSTSTSSDCSAACITQEYLYLNDDGNDMIHKFQIMPNGDLIEIGEPWFQDDAIVNSPHGVAMDPNGFIYINSLGQTNPPPPDFLNYTVKFDCDANVIDPFAEQVRSLGHVIIDNFLYATTEDRPRHVQVFDLCDGDSSRIGYIQLDDIDASNFSDFPWGITVNPNDGMIYITEGEGNNTPGLGAIYMVDPSDPEDAGSIWQLNSVIPPIISGLQSVAGIAFDMDNNMYVAGDSIMAGGIPIHTFVKKYTESGGNWSFDSQIIDDGFTGFRGGRGLTYSMTTDRLYLGSFEDCIAEISIDPFEYSEAAYPFVVGSSAKASGIIKEGCYRGPATINTSICGDTKILLRDLINCETCGGTWSRTSGTGGIYNSCDQTFTADAGTTSTTFTYALNNDQCGAINVTVNITIADMVAATSVVCSGLTADLDLTVTNGTMPFTYDWSDDTYDNMEDPTGVPSGTYRVTVTDALGCTVADTINVSCLPEKVAIGNLVFMDVNDDGDYDMSTDMGIDGVVVELYPADSVIGTSQPLLKDTTSSGGFYIFDQLDAGMYVVHIPSSEFGTGEPLENKETASPEGGDDLIDDDADENGQNTPVNGGISSSVIDAQPNDEPTGEAGQGTYTGTLDDEDVNLTVDFGFATEKVAIGNVVFMDTNDDGDYDIGVDMGINGVVVELYPLDSVIGVHQPIMTTVTSSGPVYAPTGAGHYQFDQLDAGMYIVHIPSSEFGVGEPLENKETASPEGGDDLIDDNADENGQNTPVNGGISSSTIDLQPNDEPTGEGGSGTYTGSLDDDNVNLTVDFGFATEKVAIGNVVFMDVNDDGDYDLGTDMGIDGVVVELYPVDSVIGTHQPLLRDTTSGGGFYLFNQINAGQYVVHVPSSEFGTGEPLADKESAISEGVDDLIDDDADENGQNTPVNGGISSSVIDAQPNDEPTGEAGQGTYTGTLDDEDVNLTVDFGFATEKVAIGNVVFMDTNDDGDYDMGVDMGINGVVVELYPLDSVIGVHQPIMTTVTSSGPIYAPTGAGHYQFDQLDAGMYVVHIPSTEFGIGEPLENKETASPEGGDDLIDDNADENGQNTPVNGGISSSTIDLQPNDEPTGEGGSGTYTGSLDDDNVNLTVDFGFATEKVAIGNVVFMDVNDDGNYDLGTDMGLDDVIVELYPVDSVIGTHQPLLKDTTSGGGFYLFDQINAGQYVVHVPSSEFGVGEPLADKESAISEGVDDIMDDNADENGQNTPVNGGISTTVIDVQPNDEPTGEGGSGSYTGSLDDDNVNLTVDFGFATEKVAIGNVVFMDTNDDGDYDLGVDMAIDGVVVELYPIDSVIGVNQPLLTTMTAGGGYYLFDQLTAGQYVVHIPASEFGIGEPLENKETASPEGGDDLIDDNADENGQNTPVNGGISSSTIDLQPNDEPTVEGGSGSYTGSLDDDNVNLTVDFGFTTEKVAIGNVVFMDVSDDGNYDLGTDMGLDDVIVELYPVDSVIGTHQPLLKDTTSGGGFYLFDQINAGQYVVHVPSSEFGTGEPLADKESAISEGVDDMMDDDADENGQNTPVNGGVSTTVIDVQPNDEPTGEGGSGSYTGSLDDDNVNLTVDLGFATEKVAIGNVVFMDVNDDGDYDLGTDMGIDGVVVELYPIDSVIAVNQPLLTTMTAGGGYYLFDLLTAGQYVVHIPASEFGIGEPLENKETASPEGVDDMMDDNANENGQNTPVNGGISSSTIDLQPNDEPTGEGGSGTYTGSLDDDNVNLTVDFGFATEKVALGNVVFMDVNDDGNYDLGTDMGLDDVIVELYPLDSVIGTHQPLLKDTTSGGGFYLFDQINAGQYVVHVPSSEFGTGEPLADKESAISEGVDDIMDDDADENGQNTPVDGGVSTTVIDVQPNDEPTGEGGSGSYTGSLDDDNVNLTVDFGFATEKVAIGNVVFMDTNDDGDYDLGTDMGIDGVVVELYPIDSVIAVNQPLLTTMTAGGGYYLFDLLTAGQYVVHIPASEFGIGEPLENKETASPEGVDDMMDDNANENGQNTPVNGGISSSTIDLQPNDEPTGEGGSGTYTGSLDDDNVNLTVDFGFATEKVALGNLVFMDVNDDGNYDLGTDMGLDDVIVELYPLDSVIGTHQPLLKDTTSGGGFYLFDQINAGQYVVHVPSSQFGTGGPLADKESAISEGVDDIMDDDADENGQNTPVNGGVSTTVIDVQPNDEPTVEGGSGSYTGSLDDDNVNLTIDLGFATEKVALGNVVFMDVNDDGDYDLGTDMGIDGVTVELYPVDSVIGIHEPLLRDTTGGGGFYLFDRVTAGMYVVHIPSSEFGIGEPLENKETASPEGGDDTLDDNADENGQNTLVNGGISSSSIDVQPNDEPTGEGGSGSYTGSLDDDNVNLTVDFGFATEKVALGNVVFMDVNDDGNYDLGTDMGLDDVIVELYPLDSVIGTHQPLLKDTTSGGGFYLFDQINAGQYVVHVPSSEFGTGEPLADKESAISEGVDDIMDDDADENGQNTPVDGGVSTTVIDVQPNDEPTGEGGSGSYTGSLDDDNVNLTVDLGFATEKVGVGNVVFMDVNDDGDYDVGTDMGIDGVIVELYPVDSVIGIHEPLLRDTTGGGGFYLFDRVTAGMYVVHIPSSEFGVGQPLENKETASPEGGDDLIDDNADENGQNTLVNGGISSSAIDLQPNDEPTDEGGSVSYSGSLDDDNVNLTVDFGFMTLLSIGNQVWLDANYNGLQEMGENGIEGVEVVLHYYNPLTMACDPVDSVITDVNGFYLFDSLIVGDYIVAIPGSNFDQGAALEHLASSTGTYNQGGIYEIVGAPVDVDTTPTDDDDNGVYDSASSLYMGPGVQGAVVSDTITLVVGGEPTDEPSDMDMSGAADENSNQTVDFGFTLRVFDLALIHQVAEPGPFKPGDTVTYTLHLFNQGTLDADSISIAEYVPTGMINIDPNWLGDSFDAGSLAAGDSAEISLDLLIEQSFAGSLLTNNVEIVYGANEFSIEDEDDLISDIDGSSDDTTELSTDNNYDDDAPGTPGIMDHPTDVDDYDPAQIFVEQPDIVLTKSSMLSMGSDSIATPGDTIYYDFVITNTGNVLLDPVTLTDTKALGIVCDSTALHSGDSTACEGYYLLTQADIDRGRVYNSALAIGTTPGGIVVQDTSDTTNPNDPTQDDDDGDTPQDSTTTLVPAMPAIELIKNISHIIDNGDGFDTEGDTVVYFFKVTNIGNVTLSNVFITDTLVAVVGGPVTLAVGASDSTTFIAKYVITEADVLRGYVENSALASGLPPAPDGGLPTPVLDVSDTGDPDDTGDVGGNMDGDPTNDPIFILLCSPTVDTCPMDWNIIHGISGNGCLAPAYTSYQDIIDNTNAQISNCGIPDFIEITYQDQLIPEQCTGSSPQFDTRTVERTYAFVNTVSGDTIEMCPQEITYEIEGCSQLTDFGVIEIAGGTDISVPVGCDAPMITVLAEEEGICGYVEYMWLVTTMTNGDGTPIVPTAFNLGTVWQIIPGANDPTYDPGTIIEDTYYVRCARNFSCCQFGESNIISVLIDEAATCPTPDPIVVTKDCENNISLVSPDNDYMNGEQMKFLSDKRIDAENIVGQNSKLILQSGDVIELKNGFETQVNAILEIYNSGCPK